MTLFNDQYLLIVKFHGTDQPFKDSLWILALSFSPDIAQINLCKKVINAQ